MIQLYIDQSPHAWKVSVALEELELPYELHHVHMALQEQKRPEYLEISPWGVVPAIVDTDEGDFALTESGAILIYLAEKTGRLLAHFFTLRVVLNNELICIPNIEQVAYRWCRSFYRSYHIAKRLLLVDPHTLTDLRAIGRSNRRAPDRLVTESCTSSYTINPDRLSTKEVEPCQAIGNAGSYLLHLPRVHTQASATNPVRDSITSQREKKPRRHSLQLTTT